MVTSIPNNSATGRDSHTPFRPQSAESNITAVIRNTNVRKAEIIADVFPSE